MSQSRRCVLLLAILSGGLWAPIAVAQSLRLTARSNDAPAPTACPNEMPRGLGEWPDGPRLRLAGYGYFEEVCAASRRAPHVTLGESFHERASVFPSDPIEQELEAMGAAGIFIAGARQEVLELLREGDSCSGWYAQAEPDPAEKFASLHFQIDGNGESTVQFSFASPEQFYRQPYVARAQEGVGRGSVITLNAHGAFFQHSVPPDLRVTSYLHVGDYLGGSIRAQVTTLLHEYAHIIGLLPVDTGEANSALLSVQNTKTVLRYCRKQIEASSNRTIMFVVSSGGPEQPAKQK